MSTIFALTPVDGKCHFFNFAKVLPLITIVTDGQSERQTGKQTDRQTDGQAKTQPWREKQASPYP